MGAGSQKGTPDGQGAAIYARTHMLMHTHICSCIRTYTHAHAYMDTYCSYRPASLLLLLKPRGAATDALAHGIVMALTQRSWRSSHGAQEAVLAVTQQSWRSRNNPAAPETVLALMKPSWPDAWGGGRFSQRLPRGRGPNAALLPLRIRNCRGLHARARARVFVCGGVTVGWLVGGPRVGD